MTALVTILAASFAAAVAVWLIPSSIQIVSWSRTAIDRVALLAPLYLFWAALAAGATLAAMVWFAGPRTAESRVRRAHVIAPIAALWLWTIPFLPLVGDSFPVLLALAGPLRWLIAAAAVFSSGWRWFQGSRARVWATLPRLPGRKTAFALSLAIYLLFGFRSLSTMGLGGDEPHYLVITHSLLVDHDLKIENNHTREDYRAFFGGSLRPDYMQRGVNGEIYSIHAPGLPALLLPGYAVAGSRGALAIICLLAALTALAIFDVAARIGGTTVAWATWVSACLTVPFIPHAWAIYPEIAGAALVAWTIVWATASGETERAPSIVTWMVRGICLATLPWLHTKFVVFSVALTLWLLVGLRGRVKAALALLVPIAVSGIAWLATFYVIYGRFDPEAPYGTYTDQFVRFENIPRSILGILFDQKFGLFVYAPVYLLAAIGAWLLAWDKQWRPLAVALLSTALFYAVGSARLYMWWGGSGAPARFIVPIVPLLAPMIAIALSRLQTLTVRANVWIVVMVSVLVSASGILGSEPLLLFSDPHGSARILQQLQGSAPLTAALPTFTDENWTTPLAHLGPWLLAGIVAFATARRLRLSTFWVVTIEGSAFFIVAAMLSGPFAADVRADSVTRGRLALLTAYDPERLRAFDYARLSKILPPDWLNAGKLAIDLDPSQPADEQGRLTGPLALPPGRYEVKVWFEGQRQRDGDLILGPGRGQVLVRLPGPLANPTVAMLDLPVPIPQLWVQLTEVASAQVATRVELSPVSIVPVSDRPSVEARAIESIPTRPNAYMVYADDYTYPEGGVFWTRGTGLGEVLVVPEGAGQIDFTLHVGPAGGPVHLVVAGQAQDVDMKGDETRVISVPIPPGTMYVPVTIQSTSAFQPAAVDPQSTDTRSLGCQVRVEVR